MPINPMPASQANSHDAYQVHIMDATSRRVLQPRDKAEQLALANGTTVIARASATYTAGQTIAVYGDGLSEIATYMHDNDTFDWYKTGMSIGPEPGVAETTDYPAVPAMKFVKFVKFSGASALAGAYQ